MDRRRPALLDVLDEIEGNEGGDLREPEKIGGRRRKRKRRGRGESWRAASGRTERERGHGEMS